MKGKLLNFLLILVSFCVTLGAGEIAFRLMRPSTSITDNAEKRPLEKLIEFDTKLQTRYRANVSGLVKSQYGEFEIKYATNALGLRDRPLEADGKPRVLVVGNSFVEGWGVEEELGLVQSAEQALNQNRARPLRLINAGMSGFGAAQSYLLGEELLDKTKPSAVVFVYTSTMVQADHQFLALADRDANGLATGLSSDALLTPPVIENHASKSIVGTWLKAIAPYSAMARSAESYLTAHVARESIRPGDPATDLLAGIRADKSQLAALHAPSLAHVRALAHQAKIAGIPFLMIHLPMVHQISADEWAIGRAAYGLDRQVYAAHDMEIVQNYCHANGIACSSAKNHLAQTILDNNGQSHFYYQFDFHPTAAGYQTIGRWMATELGRILQAPSPEDERVVRH